MTGIIKVTITGADHSIDVSTLKLLSEKYSFVEWGILFSKNKQGEMRYPTNDWVNQLRELKLEFPEMKLSAHLCGQWVTELCSDSFTFLNHLDGIHTIFDRAQLNMTDQRFMSLDFGVIKERLGTFPAAILQTKRAFERFEWVRLLNKSEGPRLDMLYDASGGKGKSPKHWAKPVDGVFCGQAGGLSADNLNEQWLEIAKVSEGYDIWIDMESGVRDSENRFDLDKVEKVLEISANMVNLEKELAVL